MDKREGASYSVVGESIFVVGGWTAQEECSRCVKEFLVKERRWRDREPLAVGRYIHAAAVLNAGVEKTLLGVFGGMNGKGLSSCEVYDISRDSWVKLPDLREKRSDRPAAACLPGDSRIFVFGGWDGSSGLASVEFCQLGADWRERATSARTEVFWQPAAPMRISRSDLAATHAQGKIMIAGGYDGNEYLNVVELFTPPDASNPLGQWTALANMQQPRACVTLLTSTNAVFALGNDVIASNTVETFTPPAASAGPGNDLTSWRWASRSPVEMLDYIQWTASI